MVGVNCHFDMFVALETMKKMKAGLQAAGLHPYLMMQPVIIMTTMMMTQMMMTTMMMTAMIMTTIMMTATMTIGQTDYYDLCRLPICARMQGSKV